MDVYKEVLDLNLKIMQSLIKKTPDITTEMSSTQEAALSVLIPQLSLFFSLVDFWLSYYYRGIGTLSFSMCWTFQATSAFNIATCPAVLGL